MNEKLLLGLSEPLTVKQMMEGTGLTKKEVEEALKNLKDEGILIEVFKTDKGVMYHIDLEAIRGYDGRGNK